MQDQSPNHRLTQTSTGNSDGSSKIRALFDKGGDKAVRRRIALIGTFAPRKCGIATFTTDIFEKFAEFEPGVAVDVYPLDDPAAPIEYDGVAQTIDSADPDSYARAAQAINASGVDAVWLQHEYGIFGGPDGEMVTDFVDRLAPPLILTPHTVLGAPGERQEAILAHLVARASRIMVMSRHARDLLATRYGAPHELLEVIAHGAPDRPFGREEEFKSRLGLAGHKVLTTFGLIGPGKGLEHVIEALPAIVARHPHTIYRIVGATHPNLVASDGEAYRDSLRELADRLGVAGHIEWVNRFVETGELLDQLEACDIYLTPYPNLQQSTSGTLSYAVALGKAVISTRYLHATELMEDGVGFLIDPGSSDIIAATVNSLLDDPEALDSLKRRAYAKGRETIWPRFARAAARMVEKACAPVAGAAPTHVAPGLSVVTSMSDATGMLQHAIGIVPDRRHGYCLDDNARALMLMNVATGIAPEERMQWLLTYASFIQHAWNPDREVFRNFMHFERTWCEDAGSEDSNGRAFWALGRTMECAPDASLREWACAWYDNVLPAMSRLESPRAAAFVMLGAAARLRVDPEHRASRDILEKGAAFLAHLLDAVRRPDWAWFETVLGYDNPRLSQALIEAGMALSRDDLVRVGVDSLDWIAGRQVAASGHFRPIGSESFGRARTALPFDQQPLEAQAAIEASLAAWRATGDARWQRHVECAWAWFFGANDRGVMLADLATGRCRDGINPRGANANSGAESILAFQLAYYSMLALAHHTTDDSAGGQDGARKQRIEVAFASP